MVMIVVVVTAVTNMVEIRDKTIIDTVVKLNSTRTIIEIVLSRGEGVRILNF